ncbi:MAG: ABC transporter permease [Caldilinea sp. CFX5]|nr:ABC transporter permease [Caldilinea sp. CFX5]
MLKYILTRLAIAIPTFLAVMLITFTLTALSPFDPVAMMLAEQPNLDTLQKDEVVKRIRQQYGLDDSFLVQFTKYVQRVMQGDLGVSINGQRDVLRAMVKTFPISLQLGLAGAVVTALIGIPLGAIAALKQNTWIDYTIVGGTLVFRSLPVFVLAPLLVVFFVLILGVMRRVPLGWDGLFHSKTLLPIFILTLGPLPVVVRQTRQAVLDIFAQDYIRTAKAKGLQLWVIIGRHILRNALIPVVTTLGFIAEGLIVGSIFLDRIFAIPGFGGVAEGAIRGFDYPMLLGVTMITSLMIILTNLLVDLIYPFLDPRIQLE